MSCSAHVLDMVKPEWSAKASPTAADEMPMLIVVGRVLHTQVDLYSSAIGAILVTLAGGVTNDRSRT